MGSRRSPYVPVRTPSPTKPAWAGSWPDPPPQIKATLDGSGEATKTTLIHENLIRRAISGEYALSHLCLLHRGPILGLVRIDL